MQVLFHIKSTLTQVTCSITYSVMLNAFTFEISIFKDFLFLTLRFEQKAKIWIWVTSEVSSFRVVRKVHGCILID